MKPNVRIQSSVILRPGNGRMKPVLLPPGPSSATFLIPSFLRCLQELLAAAASGALPCASVAASYHAHLYPLCAPCHASGASGITYGLAQPALSLPSKAPPCLGRYTAPTSHAS